MNDLIHEHFIERTGLRGWIVALFVTVALGVVLVSVSGALVSAETAPADAYTTALPIIANPYSPPDSISLEPFATLDLDHFQDCNNDGIKDGPFAPTITDIANAGDDRLFIVERSGLIFVAQSDGTILPTPFLDIRDKVKGFPDCQMNWEEGLLGLAFHPNYQNNGFFYVAYTGANPSYGDPGSPYPEEAYQILLRRFQVSASNPNVANPAPNPPEPLMMIGKPYSADEGQEDHSVHNGGDLNFGPDGFLYMSTGDGGPDPKPPHDPTRIAGDIFNHSQRLDVNLGKILRIDVDQNSPILPYSTRCSVGRHYTIPVDNPFAYGPANACSEIWALGLRNPWRFSFDSVTGDLYIADVGEWQYEEVNYQPAGQGAGANYGWHCWEGPLDYSTVFPEVASNCTGTSYVQPVISYATSGTPPCSITGGFVYRGNEVPGLNGQYIYGDFCNGMIWRTGHDWVPVEVLDGPNNFLSTFGEDVHGELYVGGFMNKTIYKIAP